MRSIVCCFIIFLHYHYALAKTQNITAEEKAYIDYLKNSDISGDYGKAKPSKDLTNNGSFYLKQQAMMLKDNSKALRVAPKIRSNIVLAENTAPSKTFRLKTEAKSEDDIVVEKEEAINKKTASYRSIFGSFVGGGSSSISGQEERLTTPSTSITTASYTSYQTFDANVTYLPSFDVGIRVGMQYQAFAGVRYPIAYRMEFEFFYMRMNAQISSLTTDTTTATGSPGSNFSLPKNYGNGHFFHGGFNAYADLFKFGPGYIYLGVGVGIGGMVFDVANNAGLVAPTFSGFIGYNIDLPKGITISIGYRFMTNLGSYYQHTTPIQDNNGVLPDNRPVQKDEAVYAPQFIHKLEVAFLFF